MLISEGQLMAEEVFMNALYGKHYIVLQYYTTLCIFCFQGCYNDAYSPIFLLIQIGHVPETSHRAIARRNKAVMIQGVPFFSR